MSNPIISVENLGKAYRLGLKDETPDTLVGMATSWIKAPLHNFKKLRRLDVSQACTEDEDVFWALKDVSFEVNQGDVVGIIGRNGAGKSTLLKILSRITEPTAGRAVIRGRVSSLLEVGTGFHPELSGRDNIYMNGTILGMKKREIDNKFDEIVDFSGVEKFLDTPVKRYSSGMMVRLAFSVAAHLEPEILIVDEVLAVGDAEFQKKCMGKMQDVAEGGRTVLFVSHNMGAVQNLCKLGVLLQNGSITDYGSSEKVVLNYMNSASCEAQHGDIDLRSHSGRRPKSIEIFKRLRLMKPDGSISQNLVSEECLTIELELDSKIKNEELTVHVAITDSYENKLFTFGSNYSGIQVKLTNESTKILCTIPSLPLNKGRFNIILGLARRGGEWIDCIDNAASIDVSLSNTTIRDSCLSTSSGPIIVNANWSVLKNEIQQIESV